MPCPTCNSSRRPWPKRLDPQAVICLDCGKITTAEKWEKGPRNKRAAASLSKAANHGLVSGILPDFHVEAPSVRSPAGSKKWLSNKKPEQISELSVTPGKAWPRSTLIERKKAEMQLSALSADASNSKPDLESLKKRGFLAEAKQPKKGLPLSLERDQWGIPMDGNCLFRSIWEGLTRVLPNIGFATNDDLRRMAVGYLRNDEELRRIGAVTTEYLDLMSISGTWGGELEAMALAHVWGVRITVHAPTYTITYNESATTGIDIYYNGEDHYSIGRIA